MDQAIRLDAIQENTMCSTMVDEVFYVMEKSCDRALSICDFRLVSSVSLQLLVSSGVFGSQFSFMVRSFNT